MSNFIRIFGKSINADTIASVTHNEGRECTIKLKDGEVVTTKHFNDSQLMQLIPNHHAVELWKFYCPPENGSPFIEKQPVIAWRGDGSYLEPVTPDPVRDDDYILHYIDLGIFVSAGDGQTWDSEAELIEYFKNKETN